MARSKLNIITAVAIVVIAASLWFLIQARASLRERDEQVQRLRDRATQLEGEVARLSSTSSFGLTVEDGETYLSLGYEEFDATPGSGFRRFRDQPRHPSQAGELIAAYLQLHPELPLDKRINLHGHAAQLFSMGGMNERAIGHLDWLRSQNPRNHWADATKAFLLFDREGLLAARQRMAEGDAAELVDLLIEHFGESYADISRWSPICSTVRLPTGATANHRATADHLAIAFGLPVIAHDPSAEGGIPSGCIWLEVRPMGGTPDVEGYVILHMNNSTVITATDEQRLAAAVKRFIESSRQHNGKRQAPFGLATSFELAR